MKTPTIGFHFDADTHRYYLDGKQMTGVTTILGVLAKPALIQWAANEAVKYIAAHLPEAILNHENLNSVLEIARTAHAQKRDKAADQGTLAHLFINQWILAEIKRTHFELTEKEREEFGYPEEVPELKIITDNFLKWVEGAKPKFTASEKVVYSREHWYAGTFDFMAEIGGKTYLGDIKTGSGIYPEQFWQCAGYQLALQEMEPDAKIDGHIIVNPTKKGALNVQEQYDYEAAKQGFLAALKIYRLLNNHE